MHLCRIDIHGVFEVLRQTLGILSASKNKQCKTHCFYNLIFMHIGTLYITFLGGNYSLGLSVYYKNALAVYSLFLTVAKPSFPSTPHTLLLTPSYLSVPPQCTWTTRARTATDRCPTCLPAPCPLTSSRSPLLSPSWAHPVLRPPISSRYIHTYTTVLPQPDTV